MISPVSGTQSTKQINRQNTTFTAFLSLLRLYVHVSPVAGLGLPHSGRGGNHLVAIQAHRPASPPMHPWHLQSLAPGPGTFPSAYKLSLPPILKDPLHTSASKLLINWGSVGSSLCASEDQLRVPVGCTKHVGSARTYITAIFQKINMNTFKALRIWDKSLKKKESSIRQQIIVLFLDKYPCTVL